MAVVKKQKVEETMGERMITEIIARSATSVAVETAAELNTEIKAFAEQASRAETKADTALAEIQSLKATVAKL